MVAQKQTAISVCVRALRNKLIRAYYKEMKLPSATDNRSEAITFQHLLIVKLLRPERFEAALRLYVNEHVKSTELSEVSASNVDFGTAYV